MVPKRFEPNFFLKCFPSVQSAKRVRFFQKTFPALSPGGIAPRKFSCSHQLFLSSKRFEPKNFRQSALKLSQFQSTLTFHHPSEGGALKKGFLERKKELHKRRALEETVQNNKCQKKFRAPKQSKEEEKKNDSTHSVYYYV